jgi:RNA polymerase subunit RPABC4/transcription elongation factor Spt4
MASYCRRCRTRLKIMQSRCPYCRERSLSWLHLTSIAVLALIVALLFLKVA